MVSGPERPHRLRARQRGRRHLRPDHRPQATDKSVNAVYAQMAAGRRPRQGHSRPPSTSACPQEHPRPHRIAVHRARHRHRQRPGHGRGLRDPRQPRQSTAVHPRRQGHQGRRGPRPARRGAPSRRSAARPPTPPPRSCRASSRAARGTAAQAAGRPAAGKTGTAEEDKAAWFAGYTPDLATVVAVIGQDPDTGAQEPLYGALGLSRVNGGGSPAQIWAAVHRAPRCKGTSVQDFDLTSRRAPSAPSSPRRTGRRHRPDRHRHPGSPPADRRRPARPAAHPAHRPNPSTADRARPTGPPTADPPTEGTTATDAHRRRRRHPPGPASAEEADRTGPGRP